MAINLDGVFLCCRAVVTVMLKGENGRIVNLASIAGKEDNPNASCYSASKAGVIALTKSLGKELAQTSIRVNCVAPAAIETELLRQMTPEFTQFVISKIPMGRWVSPMKLPKWWSGSCRRPARSRPERSFTSPAVARHIETDGP